MAQSFVMDRQGGGLVEALEDGRAGGREGLSERVVSDVSGFLSISF
jgi:hypothetical protein